MRCGLVHPSRIGASKSEPFAAQGKKE